MAGKRRSRDTFLHGFRRAVEWSVVIVAVGAALAAVVIPRLAGATPYAVLTGSMRPDMPPGTLVVVRPVDPDDLTIGSVVTFLPKQDEPDVVTHRIVGQGFDVAGHPVYRTQGDANPAPDPGSIRDFQVIGKRWYSVPYLGYLTDLLSGRQREIGTYVVVGCLLLYALAMSVGSLRDRTRRPPEVSHA